MKFIVEKTGKISGEALIPSSKSHTIRGVVFASLADGVSELINPLSSEDTRAAFDACAALGAGTSGFSSEKWIIRGFNGEPVTPGRVINMANSGTSLNLFVGAACLGTSEIVFDGDESLRKRPVQPLLDALNALGAEAVSTGKNGSPPLRVRGRIKGGAVKLDGISSQFVSSLLISCPLADADTEISVFNIHETPYIQMTLKWLDEQGIVYEKKDDFSFFRVKGGQRYRSFKKRISGDWSSGTFFLAAGALTESDILLKGLDMNDAQGDKAVVEYVKKMGADVRVESEGVRIRGGRLKGAEIDLNATPDALPAMAVLGCFAEGTTILYNVAHARIKETDRIKVMAEELAKMNADIQETEDGLIIRQSSLTGAEVSGHRDHRVVMSLSLAGLIARGITTIDTAEAVNVTFPNFTRLMKSIGANIREE